MPEITEKGYERSNPMSNPREKKLPIKQVLVPANSEMEEDEYGEWVSLEDYQAKIQEVEAQPDDERDPYSEFQKELEVLISALDKYFFWLNAHSLESRTDTPDFILAEYVVEGLRALEHLKHAYSAWSNPSIKKPPKESE